MATDLGREMRAAGWVRVGVRGGHDVFRHPLRPGLIVIRRARLVMGRGLVAAVRAADRR